MAIRVAINGFGRIGRNILRAIAESGRKDIEVVGINDLGPVETNAHLLRFDSVHGRFPGTVTVDGDSIVYPASENISIAVDTERGLLTPVVKNAGDLNVAGLARAIADVAARTGVSKAMVHNVFGSKADLALANGCDHVILYNEENFVERVKQISRGELCDVVYDGVGKTTFPGSLSCLRPRGLFVSFGNASGPVPPFPLAELNNHGSLFATRPKLNDYVGTRKELLEGADTLFAAVINGKLHVPINHAYALKDAAKAHIDLESRATTGAAILRP